MYCQSTNWNQNVDAVRIFVKTSEVYPSLKYIQTVSVELILITPLNQYYVIGREEAMLARWVVLVPVSKLFFMTAASPSREIQCTSPIIPFKLKIGDAIHGDILP
ncbi:hypothetical protein DAPPUDRAFT_265111 [Daphnia pulex]|uniref:Uncharacterized protein n=1 Tax=Daphnia pulex TaxID=6669 RepID=E9HSW2_DAPPU|nr:hypothetical protein DAPPUDRAFT_265111 [Daphnia pulex]|eukprot:EFX65170.1 hypothetical protein DAPPUDRAFT_265111 [Daphnia pulex]